AESKQTQKQPPKPREGNAQFYCRYKPSSQQPADEPASQRACSNRNHPAVAGGSAGEAERPGCNQCRSRADSLPRSTWNSVEDFTNIQSLAAHGATVCSDRSDSLRH